MKKAIIFDMDGTLMDSVADIALCCNEALAHFGFPTHSVERYSKEFVGWGLKVLIDKSTPDDITPEKYAEVTALYKKLYQECCEKGGTTFPGVNKMLAEVKAAGFVTAVLTNKPDSMTQALKNNAFDGNLDVAWGPKEGMPTKPDAGFTKALIKELGCEISAYVGDSEVDIATGKNAGLYVIGVSWGTRTHEFMLENGADMVVDTTEELTRALLARA